MTVISERKSLFDVVTRLEDGSLNPKELSKGMRKECVRYFITKGYLDMEIAMLLRVTIRSFYRYLKEIRKENILTLGADFQRGLVGEVVNNLKLQHSRLKRLSYSEDLTDYERVRAICASCQVQKDIVAILERLGYLNREVIEVKTESDAAKELFAPDDPILSKADKLLPEQTAEIINVLKSSEQCDMRKIAVMVQLYITDNKKKGLYEDDGTLKTGSELSNVIVLRPENTQPIETKQFVTTG